MALHVIPEDGVKHLPARDCPCGPTSGKRLDQGVMRTVYTHQETAAKHPELHDRHAVPDGEAGYVDQGAGELPTGVARIMPGEDPEVGPEAECGHVVVQTNAGEWQHHDIPGDDAPHSPTSECGCGPQRHVTAQGHVVYEHADQAAGEQDDDEEV